MKAFLFREGEEKTSHTFCLMVDSFTKRYSKRGMFIKLEIGCFRHIPGSVQDFSNIFILPAMMWMPLQFGSESHTIPQTWFTKVTQLHKLLTNRGRDSTSRLLRGKMTKESTQNACCKKGLLLLLAVGKMQGLVFAQMQLCVLGLCVVIPQTLSTMDRACWSFERIWNHLISHLSVVMSFFDCM